MVRNVQVQLVDQREGMPLKEDFCIVETDIPKISENQILVRVIYLSLDPYIRKAMRGDHPGHTILIPGSVIYGRSICQIEESKDSKYKAGMFIVAETGWQSYASIYSSQIVQCLDSSFTPLSSALSVLGMPGLTAWGSVDHLGKPKIGETVLVSAAAGPVGGCVGQLAKLRGARVVGVAGSSEKCEIVKNIYGFDSCVNYKKDGWISDLSEACPEGIDYYHDNVGGELLLAVVGQMSLNSRVVMCGRPADYHSKNFIAVQLGPFIARRVKLMGMVVYDYEYDFNRYLKFAKFYMNKGRLTVKEDIVNGIENTPEHFVKLMKGNNIGKAIVAVDFENFN